MNRHLLVDFPSYSTEEMIRRSAELLAYMQRRRTVRDFQPTAPPREVIEACLLTAGSAPSGANQQPWHFVVVSDPQIKRVLREAAEAEEREFYEHRAPQQWLDLLAPIGVDANKPFLEVAPYLIVIFRKTHEFLPDGAAAKTYYSSESIGIATGMLISALHHCGLATLTHTPSPMGFLNDVLQRPSNERPFLILVTGYPAQDATAPRITKKKLDDIATFR